MARVGKYRTYDPDKNIEIVEGIRFKRCSKCKHTTEENLYSFQYQYGFPVRHSWCPTCLKNKGIEYKKRTQPGYNPRKPRDLISPRVCEGECELKLDISQFIKIRDKTLKGEDKFYITKKCRKCFNAHRKKIKQDKKNKKLGENS